MTRNILAAACLLATCGSSALAQIDKPERQPLGRERVAEQRRDVKLDLDRESATLASGRYMLVLTPSKVGGKAAPRSAEPIASSVTVTQSGSKLTIGNAEGLSLSGTAKGAHFTLSGANGDGKLTLDGTAANGGADGDFKLGFSGGPQVEGNFILASPNSAGIQANKKLQDFDEARKKQAQKADCNWWCTIKGWFTL